MSCDWFRGQVSTLFSFPLAAVNDKSILFIVSSKPNLTTILLDHLSFSLFWNCILLHSSYLCNFNMLLKYLNVNEFFWTSRKTSLYSTAPSNSLLSFTAKLIWVSCTLTISPSFPLILFWEHWNLVSTVTIPLKLLVLTSNSTCSYEWFPWLSAQQGILNFFAYLIIWHHLLLMTICTIWGISFLGLCDTTLANVFSASLDLSSWSLLHM